MKALMKQAAGVALHHLGGLAALRWMHRREFAVLMFHKFGEAERENVKTLCEHITQYFQPVSLNDVCASLESGKALPERALAVTIDDGYRNFAQHGLPLFRDHRIPTTLYVVSGFAAGRLWLWPDQVDYALNACQKANVTAEVHGERLALNLSTPRDRAASIERLQEKLKAVPNEVRLAFLDKLGAFCGVTVPQAPPIGRDALTWSELKDLTKDGVEIGCHTETHPILSRVASDTQLEREIRDAGLEIAENVGRPVRHFCYPNGKAPDINSAVIEQVDKAGYRSAVTCTWGMNRSDSARRLEIRRTPLDSTTTPRYGVELLAGLHM